MHSTEQSPWVRYGAALLCAALAALVIFVVPRPTVLLSPFFLFYLAVTVAAWFGGFGPGLLVVALGSALVVFAVLPPLNVNEPETQMYLARLVLFVLAGLLIAVLNGRLHAVQRKLLKEAAAAHRSAARAERLAETNLIGVFFSDLEGNVSRGNDEFLRLGGLSRDELAAGTVNWQRVTAPEHRSRDADALAEIRQRGVCTPFEKDHVLADGKRVPVLQGYGRIEGTEELVGFVLDLTERKRAEAEARAQRERLAAMSRDLMLAEERERRRIATVLHDVVGQSLAVARIKTRSIHSAPADPEKVKAQAREAGEFLDTAIDHTRTLTSEISPPVLYELGLPPALAWLADRFNAQHRTRFAVEDDRLEKPLTHEARIVLFQAVRELFHNVIKHAQATHCVARVARNGDVIRVEVADDGRGIETPQEAGDFRGGGFGLFNIRERLAGIGGRLHVRSQPGRGTTVEIHVPLAGYDGVDVPAGGDVPLRGPIEDVVATVPQEVVAKPASATAPDQRN